MAVARHKRAVGGVKAANRVEVHRFLCRREAESNAVPVLVQVLALYCFILFFLFTFREHAHTRARTLQTSSFLLRCIVCTHEKVRNLANEMI